MLLNHYRELALHYRAFLIALFVITTGTAFLFSRHELRVMPIYTASVMLSLQPGESEIMFARDFIQGGRTFANNAISQTHIESIRSSEVATLTVDRLFPELGEEQAGPVDDAHYTGPGIRAALGRYLNQFRSRPETLSDPHAERVAALMNSVAVEMIEGSFILKISVSWNDPRIAADAANTLADVYIDRMEDRAYASAENRRQLVQHEIDTVGERNSRLRRQRMELERDLGIFDINSEQQALLNARETERSRLADAISDLQAFEERHSEIAASRETLRLAGRENIVSDGIALQAITRAELESRVSVRRAQIDHIDQALSALRHHHDEIEALSADIESLEQDLIELNHVRLTLRLNRDDNTDGKLRVIEAAAVPPSPASPNVPVQTIIAALASVTLGAFAVVSIDTLSNTVKTSADLDRLFGDRGLGRVSLRRSAGGLSRGDVATVGRRLRLHGTPEPRAGGVMAFGSDADAEAAARVIDAALGVDLSGSGGSTTRRLGGLGEDFSLASIEPGIDWIVVAMRPAEAVESDIAGILEEVKNRGVRVVFGLLLSP